MMPKKSESSSKSKKYKYIPPPRTESCRPYRKYEPSEDKMDDRTVYSMSYTSANIKGQEEDDTSQTPCQPYHFQPLCSICPFFSNGPLWNASYETEQKVSYQPRNPSKPAMPWKRKAKYVAPQMKMEDQTVQKLSYGPPGEFVEWTDDEDYSYRPTGPLNTLKPPCDGYNMCCNTCCHQEPVPDKDSEIVYLY